MKFIRAIFFLSLCSCASTQLQKKLISVEDEFQDHVGFMLLDPTSDKPLLEYKSNKYFTPASNTKILTFYSAMQMVKDSLPALYYQEIGDSLIFWGSGNPAFLYKDYSDTSTFKFLNQTDKNLYYSDHNFQDEKYGPGWAWEDLEYDWCAEKSSFPIYGNAFSIAKNAETNELTITPKFFESFIISADSADKPAIDRQLGTNNFIHHPGKGKLEKKRSFGTSGQLVADMLYDTLDKSVTYSQIPLANDKKVLYSTISKPLLTEMMVESDNMVAEQLLLVISGMVTDTLNTSKAINFIQDNYLKNAPDKPKWIDGSGLSRYNAVTPRTLVWILNQLYKQYGDEIMEYFSVGGESGTLKNYFKEEKPYIFAKTGTLTKHHNLSGYLKTKKGKIYIFSFMNNNYTTPSYPVKGKMEELLHDFYLNN